jgi:uncharacterized protein with HEPN domain
LTLEGNAETSGNIAERDRLTVQDLLEFCAQAARLVSRGRRDYDSDEMLRLAAEALTHRIGEAAGRLSQSFQAAHGDVPWRAIRGMRNVIAHDCGRVDHAIMWNTLQHDFPRLASSLAAEVRTPVADDPP